MGTKHIVPRAEGQGGIGTATLGWGELFITNTTADSSTQGGKLTLTSNDGNAMQSGSRLGVIEFKGAESSSALTIGARIEAICDAAWTATENGASLKFFTTDANASESLVLTLDSDKLAVFTGAVAINGDLTVNGTQTTVNSQTVTIDDPVFTLGGDTDHTSDDNKDRGIEFRYYSGSAKLGFFGWDDSASAFTFIADASNSGETFSGSSGNVIFGNITGTLQTAAQTNITSVGALNGGTITSGFGAINNGASTITTTGLISGGSLDIDNVLINGTTIGHTDDTDLMTLSSGVLTVAGELDAVSLDISGDADIDGTLEADVITVNGTALNTVIAGVTVTNATNSAHVLVTDNESTNENNLITFVEGATSSTGNVGLEMDGNLTYNPSTGTVTATGFSGNLTGTLQTAAQGNITSLGTLTTLTVDNVVINGTTIGHTNNSSLMTLASGSLTVAGNIAIPNDGTIGSAGTAGAIAIDSSGNTTFSQTIKAAGYADNSNGTRVMSLAFSSPNPNLVIADQSSGNISPSANTRTILSIAGTDNFLQLNRNVNGESNAQNGNVMLGATQSFNAIYSREVDNTDKEFRILTGTTARLTISSGGDATFSGNVSLADTKYIQLNNTSTDWRLRADNAGKFIIQTSGGSEFFKIRNNGEVAFGNGTAFNQFFNVRSSSTSQSLINIGTSDNSETLNVGVLGSAGYVMMENSAALNIGTGGVTRMSISSGGITSLLTNQAKTSTSNVEYALLGRTNESTNYSALQLLQKGGASNSVRNWSLQTIESGVANAGNIVLQPSGGNVGIAKSPSTYRLDLETTSGGNGLKITRGTADFQVFQAANGASYVGTGNADTLHLITGGSSKMSIASNGVATFSNYIDTPEVRQGGEFMIGRSSNIIRIGSGDGSDSLSFYAGGSERLVISSEGAANFTGSVTNAHMMTIINSKSTPYGIYQRFISEQNNESSDFIRFQDGTEVKFYVYSNGNVKNKNNSYSAISDVKLKENIVDTPNKLNDILKVKVRNYNFKNDNLKQIGVIAQELESIFPSLVSESPDTEIIDKKVVDLGTTTKSVKYSVFVPILIKAIQEQQTIIEDLKSRIKTLEE